MEVAEIRDIETLIPYYGNSILWHEVKRLTAPGENYGSTMLSVVLTVKTKLGGTQKVYTAAKMIPTNEFVQKIFNTQVTFRNEIGFYQQVIPALVNLQRENGVTEDVDFAAKCLGSRLNLDGSDKVDSDAALILENLKAQNFETLERTEGLDFDAATLVLTSLARFHALTLALKLKKPEEFEKKVRPYLALWQQKEEMHNNGLRDLERLVDQLDEIKALKERVLTGFDRLAKETQPREPFATMTHNDCWTNNTMFKLEGTTPVRNVLVDFQVCSYGSPARDIVFFIFSSVKNDVVEEKYDQLVKQYYQVFISVLEELKCDVSPFTYDGLLQEIDVEAKYSQFGHVVFMLTPIYIDQENVIDANDISPEKMTHFEPSEKQKRKLLFVVKEFAKRNWI